MQVYVLTTALLCHHRHHCCLLAPLDWVAPNVGSSEPCQVHRSMWGCGISDHSVQYHIDQRCYTMLGPVSVWVGDCLRAGKPPRRKTRNSGLLSPCLCGRIEWVPEKVGRVNRHIEWYPSLYPWYRSVVLVPGWKGWLAEISADLREAVAHMRHVRDDALYKSTVTWRLLYSLEWCDMRMSWQSFLTLQRKHKQNLFSVDHSCSIAQWGRDAWSVPERLELRYYNKGAI